MAGKRFFVVLHERGSQAREKGRAALAGHIGRTRELLAAALGCAVRFALQTGNNFC